MKKPDILAALEPVVKALDKLGAPYYIGGSVASSAYGIARATLDVDVVSDLKPQHVASLVNNLESAFDSRLIMTDIAIKVESLSKLYKIGARDKSN